VKDDQIVAVLGPLAAKLGVAAEHLWAVLLRQAPITGAMSLVFYAFLIACCFGLFRWIKFVRDKVDNDRWDEISYLGPILGAIPLVIGIVIAIDYLPLTVAAFFNPEYWALHEIIGHAK
jgi:hypothetical protein